MNTIGKEFLLSIGNSLQTCSRKSMHSFNLGGISLRTGSSHARSRNSMHSFNSGGNFSLRIFGESHASIHFIMGSHGEGFFWDFSYFYLGGSFTINQSINHTEIS